MGEKFNLKVRNMGDKNVIGIALVLAVMVALILNIGMPVSAVNLSMVVTEPDEPLSANAQFNITAVVSETSGVFSGIFTDFAGGSFEDPDYNNSVAGDWNIIDLNSVQSARKNLWASDGEHSIFSTADTTGAIDRSDSHVQLVINETENDAGTFASGADYNVCFDFKF